MRASDILLVLGALTSSGLACAPRTSAEAMTPDTAKAEAATSIQPTPLDDVVLAAGEFAEINVEMGGSSAADVALQATGGPLEWNVHSHDGDKVLIHAEGKGSEGTLHFAAPAAGPYSYLWKNSGTAPVRLTARLTAHGAIRVQSVHPAPPPR